MVHKPKAVKYKVIAGYLLLFIIAAVSLWFIYGQILKIARTNETGEDNKKIIQISNTIANLYASEAIGRISILTTSEKDYNTYNRLIDSIHNEIEIIKQDVEQSQLQKFDSIQMLLERKKNSITELIKYRKSDTQGNIFNRYITGIRSTKDSIASQVKPVKITRNNEWREMVTAILTPQQLDSLSKLEVSNDSLVMAFEKSLTDLYIKDTRMKHTLYRKEQQLLEENRIISDQVRVILASIEKEFLEKSYEKINESRNAINKTTNTMAWVGAITLLLLIIFAWIIIRDLTTNQNYRKQLELLNLENEELLRTKSMLMATVTHDLQTPLGSIIGFYDLLKNSGISPKQHQYLRNIKESADYILKLVNDLLDFSKLENNRITIEKTGFNIMQSIEGTCKALEPMAVNKGVELNWDMDDELNGIFISDPYRIKQVLTNLISNAIKFTHEGSVEVTARAEGDTIVISVLDTGIGIAREKHDDVFKEFTQAHKGIEKKFGGTGLGLTISKKIIELLGGNIKLESEEGQGSIFTITIPRIAGQEMGYEDKVLDNNSPQGPLEEYTVLLVDDDRVQLALMTELLSHYGLQVKTELNSSAVISRLEKELFDLIITDIQMPILNGFELVAQIRQHDDTAIKNLPVIALSGKKDLTADDFITRGFTASHPKPIQLESLIRNISEILEGQNPKVGVTLIEEAGTANGPLYDLKSLMVFTNNDPESLKTILHTFIESAIENCEVLKAAVANHNEQKLIETAHKMIPMLKQMEVHSIARLLVPLEDRTHNMDWKGLDIYVHALCERMSELTSEFRKKIS